jgi:hypothetical protein
MALFRPSSVTVSAAVDAITDAAGASADSEMRARALKSFNAGIKYWNGRAKWSWTFTEANPITVVAPFVFSATASGGSATVTAASSFGIKVDDWIQLNGFGLGTRVSATASGSFTVNASATGFTGTAAASGTANRDFYDVPSDWKVTYSLRWLSGNRWLKPAQRRPYDRLVADEYNTGSPMAYDNFMILTKGKVRILPSPSEAGVMQLRYHRAIAQGTAVAETTVLDVPADYDDYLVAYGKWHFLVDKGESRGDQATTWLSVSQEGIKTMLADQTNQPDEDLQFQPGTERGWPDPRSTRFVDTGEW